MTNQQLGKVKPSEAPLYHYDNASNMDSNGLFDNNYGNNYGNMVNPDRSRAKTTSQPNHYQLNSNHHINKNTPAQFANIMKNNVSTPKTNNLFNIPKPYEMETNTNNLNMHHNPSNQASGAKIRSNSGNPHFTSSPNPRFSDHGDYVHMTKEQIMNWRAQSEDDLHQMSQKHEQLIGVILSEEEEVIGLHRQHIDDMVELIKQEMMLLHEVDKPGSDVDEYVDSLDAILLHKLEIISMLRGRLVNFREHLREEEILSKKFYEQRTEILDVFDLNDSDINRNEDMQLLDNLPDHN